MEAPGIDTTAWPLAYQILAGIGAILVGVVTTILSKRSKKEEDDPTPTHISPPPTNVDDRWLSQVRWADEVKSQDAMRSKAEENARLQITLELNGLRSDIAKMMGDMREDFSQTIEALRTSFVERTDKSDRHIQDLRTDVAVLNALVNKQGSYKPRRIGSRHKNGDEN